MEIKYEAVFGNQDLFDGAQNDIVAVRLNDYICISYGYLTQEKLDALSVAELKAIPVVAMRRIIRTPVWTKADKEVGRLPGANSKMMHDGDIVKFKGCNIFNSRLWHIESKSGVFDSVDESKCIPIETPEERAIREENYWVDAAYGNTSVYEGVTKQEDVRLKNQIRAVYRAMLSGELPLPEVQK